MAASSDKSSRRTAVQEPESDPPPVLRWTDRLLLVLLGAGILELASRLLPMAYPEGRPLAEIFSLVAILLWGAGVGFLIVRGTTLPLTRWAVVGAASMIAAFQILNVVENLPIPVLEGIFSDSSVLFAVLENTTEVLGVLLLLLSFYLAMKEARQARRQLAGEHDALAQEVAERKRAEEALRHSEERFRLILNGLQEGIAFYGPGMTPLFFNRAAAEMLGYTPEQLHRLDPMVLVHPDDRPLVRENHGRRLTGASVPRTYEFRVLHRDGRPIHVEASFDVIHHDGEIVGVQGIYRDVTERVRTREALRESEDHYRQLFEGISDLVYVVDKDLRLIAVNERVQTQLGYSREELLGLRFSDICDEESAAACRERIESALARGEGRWEGLRRRKDGTKYPVEVSARRIRYRGRPAVMLISRDISERKQAEAERKQFERQLRLAQKLESLGVLAGGIAHDFNNLLMGVLGNASLALMETDPESPVSEYLRQIEGAAQRAAELSGQMLAYSGKGRFVIEPINVTSVVEEMAHLLEASVSKKATLEYRLGSDLPMIEGDVSQLRQVMLNLVSNASDALGDTSGVITISTGRVQGTRQLLDDAYIPDDLPEGPYLYLEVQDTGCGMDAETLSKVFDPFFTTKFTGRGLGLAAVMGIVRGHRATLKVRSLPGVGSVFTVLLPEMQRSLLRPPKAIELPGGWHGSGTVLVVDDENTVRTVTRRVLERAGFTVVLASDGVEGVEAFRTYRDDLVLVLLDMTMPRLSGEEAFREMQRIRADVPVILSSGYNEPDSLDHFSAEGLAGFIQKPYRAQELLVKVRAVLEGAVA